MDTASNAFASLPPAQPPCPWVAPSSAPPCATPGLLTACPEFACAILDTWREQVAILDGAGLIVAVNRAWKQFGQQQATAALLGCGIDYSAVCAEAAVLAPAAQAVGAAIRAVLDGSLPHFEHEYACHTPDQQRWFSMRVSPLEPAGRGAVVVHTDVSERRAREAALRVSAIAFETQEGMLVTDSRSKILQVNQAFTNITGYTQEEVHGQTPAMLSSGRHDAAFYRAMWRQLAQTGLWEGEIWNRRKNGEVYPERLTIAAVHEPSGQVSNYVASLSDISQSKAASDAIRNLAFYDPLTTLPNRRLLLDRLQQAVASTERHGRHIALLFIDLDNFKQLNDSLGHGVGDLLLEQVAARLRACVREGDTVARLGGDEFVLLLDDLSSQALEAASHTEAVGRKVLTALAQVFELGQQCVHSSASIGATLFCDTSHHADALLVQADLAMYQAKKSGRNALCFFDLTMQRAVAARADLESQLRQALAAEQFELYYQIQVGAFGEALGAEALLRWRRADGSFVPPSEFIPLAEETGLILPIGAWVLEQACQCLARWQSAPTTRALVLAVNVSARQFRQAGFSAQLRSLLSSYKLDPSLLKLELTESILLDDMDGIIGVMQGLRNLGVRFSLDDFGTGYSSLQYLKRLPLSQLKIDRSFVIDLVRDASDQAIVRTIIAMAKSLNLNVIAEGVETRQQWRMLNTMGCASFQGYFFSRPLALPQFEALLGQDSANQ